MHNNNDFKLKLISPFGFRLRHPRSFNLISSPPYGVGILTAFLRKHNYYVEQEDIFARFHYGNSAFLPLELKIFKKIWLDNYINYVRIQESVKSGKMKGLLALFSDKILDYFSLEGFDAVGFSIFSFLQFPFAVMLARRLKQRANTIIVFGGPFISLYGHLFNSDIFNFADYLIVGDGRIPMLRLLSYLQGETTISGVPGLIYKDNNKVIANPREEYPIEDIPIPDFDGLAKKLYRIRKYQVKIRLLYQISRGCTGRCSFCTFPNVDRRLEFKSHSKVINELKQMKEMHDTTDFFFCDELINNSYEYLEGLCSLLIKNELNIHWVAQAKIGNLDRDILIKMKDAGCETLVFGVESGSDRMLRSMQKGFTVEEANRTVKDTAEAGIQVITHLITGFPYETQEDITKTQEFIIKNKKYVQRTQIYNFHLSYSSPIYFNPKKYGIENLVPINNYFSFGFDETNGLKWEQKREQQKENHRRILKVAYDNLKF